MSLEEVSIAGTLKQDGTLELDEKPALSPGRVTVVLRSASGGAVKPRESMVDFAMRVRQESAARGHRFMTADEIASWIEELRADDDRIEDAYGKSKSQP
jgi:hypothetical protein